MKYGVFIFNLKPTKSISKSVNVSKFLVFYIFIADPFILFKTERITLLLKAVSDDLLKRKGFVLNYFIFI